MNTKITQTIQCAQVWGDVRGRIDQAVELSGLRGYVFSKPYEGDFGGDVVFLSLCNAGCLGKIFLADIAGHGSILKDTATMFKQLLARHVNEIDNSILLKDINNETKIISSEGKFVTAVSATYSRKHKELVYAYAGHPNIVRFNSKTGDWEELRVHKHEKDRNFPLGIIPDTEYVQDVVSLLSGDLLVFFTDGLLDEKNRDKEVFGLKRVLSVCGKTESPTPALLKERILQALISFRGQDNFSDDLSILVFEVSQGGAA